jgi:hypothetical protein
MATYGSPPLIMTTIQSAFFSEGKIRETMTTSQNHNENNNNNKKREEALGQLSKVCPFLSAYFPSQKETN